jgi:pyridoxamine 5'-phosphate oxidase
MQNDLSRIRNEYSQRSLSKQVVSKDPLEQMRLWLDEAIRSQVNEPTAMNLATADSEGIPSSRMVLLKDLTDRGLVFYTNYNSRKGHQIEANAYVSLVFFWPELERQVRVEGTVEKTDEEKADEYFQSRPELSRLAAWASDQSSAVPNRSYLENRMKALTEEFEGQHIPRPPHWGGYTVIPRRFEFWQGRRNRLHDRIEYYLYDEGWKIQRLAP